MAAHLITGIFWHQARHNSDWSWFAQGTLQNSISSSATFRPGKQIILDGGTRYVLCKKLRALLQLNLQWNGTDSGTAAALTTAGAASSEGKFSPCHRGLVMPLLQLRKCMATVTAL